MPTSSSSESSSSTSTGVIQSPFALLEAVEAAIMALCTGAQEYRIGDRTLRRPDLKELRILRTSLKSEIAAIQGDRPTVSYANFQGVTL